MSQKISVTKEDLDNLLSKATVKYQRLNEKTALVEVTLESGFVIVETSSCVDPSMYDEKIGKECCMQKIRDRLWLLEGYWLQKFNWLLKESRIDVT